jgi:hypothetical protein
MEQVDPAVWLLIGVVIVLALILYLMFRRRRTTALREHFGDEYDRTVESAGGRGKAEAALEERERRVAGLEIRPLGPQERAQFTGEWQEVKAVFVESPTEAVHHADRLLVKVMKTRGFPMADFDRRYEDLTVGHAEVARHYREGHEITSRHERGDASTEDLRQAMIHFEALFDDLVRDVADEGDTRPVTSAATTTRAGSPAESRPPR